MNHRLRQLRKALDMNQVDFAKRLGLSQSALAMLEAGKRNFNENISSWSAPPSAYGKAGCTPVRGDIFASAPYTGEFLSLFETLLPET